MSARDAGRGASARNVPVRLVVTAGVAGMVFFEASTCTQFVAWCKRAIHATPCMLDFLIHLSDAYASMLLLGVPFALCIVGLFMGDFDAVNVLSYRSRGGLAAHEVKSAVVFCIVATVGVTVLAFALTVGLGLPVFNWTQYDSFYAFKIGGTYLGSSWAPFAWCILSQLLTFLLIALPVTLLRWALKTPGLALAWLGVLFVLRSTTGVFALSLAQESFTSRGMPGWTIISFVLAFAVAVGLAWVIPRSRFVVRRDFVERRV